MSGWHISLGDGGEFQVRKTVPEESRFIASDAMLNGSFPTKAEALEEFVRNRAIHIQELQRGLTKARRMLARERKKDRP